jgi:uncharacterized protein YaaQ
MCENRDINILVIVNMFGDQLNDLTDQLIEKEFYFTRINNGGGFLSMISNSLLIGIQKERYQELMDLIRRCCRRQLTHIPAQIQLESHYLSTQPISIEAEIGGANIHSIAVEHFEQF